MITANRDSKLASIKSGPKRPRPAAPELVSKRQTTTSKRKHVAALSKPTRETQSESRPQSKQDRVVAMLRRTEGVTVAAVMKATGWQKHSVHGFFAGVVRKKLALNLVSAETDGKRVYRIAVGKAGKGGLPGAKPGKPASKTDAPAPKRTAA